MGIESLWEFRSRGQSRTQEVTVRVASLSSGGPYGDPLKKRILLISDDPMTLETLELALISIGYTVQTTHHGAEALAFLRGGKFRSVMLDMDTPSRGLDMLQGVRNLDGALRIFILTGSPDVEEATKCFKIGVVDYLVKPIALDKLKGVLERRFGGVE